jgi:hypothetical protein
MLATPPKGVIGLREQAGGGDMKRAAFPGVTILLLLLGAMPLVGVRSALAQTAVPPDAKVYIVWPYDGAVISGGKFWIRMGLSGAGIAPAGVEKPNTGHHHLLIDTELPPLDQPIPNDKNHLHFGGGQTEARIELPPGKHTLQLLLGDASHVPTKPPLYSNKITITVTQ